MNTSRPFSGVVCVQGGGSKSLELPTCLRRRLGTEHAAAAISGAYFFWPGAWAPSSLADAGCRFRCARRRAVFFWRRFRGRASFKNADFGPKRRLLPPGAAEQLGRPVRCAGAAACTHMARTAVESPSSKNNNQIQTRIKSTRVTQVPRQTSHGFSRFKNIYFFRRNIL